MWRCAAIRYLLLLLLLLPAALAAPAEVCDDIPLALETYGDDYTLICEGDFSDYYYNESEQATPPVEESNPWSWVAVVVALLLLATFVIIKHHYRQQRIRHYISDCREQGFTDEQIRSRLAEQGFSTRYINRRFGSLDEGA